MIRTRETLPQHVRMLELVFRDLSRFDVIHFHCDYIHFPLLRRLACANVTTLHGQIHLHDVEAIFKEYNELPLVSISDAQRRLYRALTGRRPSITVCREICIRFSHRPASIWRFSGESRRKSDWTAPSRSPEGRECL